MPVFDHAREYEQTNEIQRLQGQEIIRKLGSLKGYKILDLGCGTGSLSNLLAELAGENGSVLAIDPDESRLRMAQELHPSPKLKYSIGSAECIPGSDYDLIFSNYVLHWCQDKTIVFNQVRKSLKIGGRFAFTAVLDLNLEPKGCISKRLYDMITQLLPSMTVNEYLSLGARNSLEVVEFYEGSYAPVFENVYKLRDHFKVHTHGFCTDTDVNIDAMLAFYGTGKRITRTQPTLHCIMKKI